MMKLTLALVLCLGAATVAHKKGMKEKHPIVSLNHKKNNQRRSTIFQHSKGLDADGQRTRDRRVVADLPLLKIPVKFHVVHHNTKGKVPLKNVLLQIEALNDAFRGRTVDTSPQAVKDHFTSAFAAKNVATDAKIEFFLSGSVNYVNNKRWYNCGESDTIYDAIRMATTVDPEKYVNMFTCNSDSILGSAVFPDEAYKPSDKRWSMMLSHYTLPGFTDDYAGDTATHELGHFFGLYHTFFEGTGNKCRSNGDDGISDTPFEDEPTYGCPVENSCTKGSNGDADQHDPVWNFMDYSDDNCMWRFTPKQITKMHAELEQYKPKLYKAAVAMAGPNAPAKTTTKPAVVQTKKATTARTTVQKTTRTKSPKVATAAPATTKAAVTLPAASDDYYDDFFSADDGDDDDFASWLEQLFGNDDATAAGGYDDDDAYDADDDYYSYDDDYTYESADDDVGYSGFWQLTDDDFLENFGYDDDDSYAYDDGYQTDDDLFDYAYYDDDAEAGDSKAFAALWGWTDWAELLASDEFDENDFFGDGQWASGLGSGFNTTDFAAPSAGGAKFQPGSCKSSSCGVRNFDRTCSCEASCEFFQDCCSNYRSVCDAVKAERKTKVSAQLLSKATQQLADEKANTAPTKLQSVSLAVPLDANLADLTVTELVEVKQKVLHAAAKAGGFNTSDVAKVALMQGGKEIGAAQRRAVSGPITANIMFKETATIDVTAVTAAMNAAIKAGTVSMKVTIAGKTIKVAVTADASVVTAATPPVTTPVSGASGLSSTVVAVVAVVAAALM